MKRFFVSLGVGIVIPALIIVAIITLKVLMAPAWGSWPSMLLWAFVWPLPVLVHFFPGMSQLSLGLVSFSVGALFDVVILSLLTNAVLPRKRKPLPTELPPEPPSFH